MESISNFNKGMDLDTNPLNLGEGKYREANNVRMVNDVGGTSFSVNNIKGNSLNISFPSIPTFQIIQVVGNSGAATQTITISGETGDPFDTTNMTPTDLYNYISNDVAYTNLGTGYNIYPGNSYLLIVPEPVFTLTISTNDTNNILITPNFVPSQKGSDLEIIGSANVRDDMYLFTTSNKTMNPGGHDGSLPTQASSVGQIWKYTYDKVSLVGSLKLIYNNYVDFSTYWAIAPTAATGRYENSQIQRIYWTDNFNKLRSINVADPNALALDVSVLNIIPAVDFDIPILTDIRNISGNKVKTGVYQCAYRLKNTGGAVTNYSELSNIVNVVGSDEATTLFKNYIGSVVGYVTEKNITWTISNIDRDFDRIEIAIIYRVNKNDPATVIGISDSPLASDTFVVSYNGLEDNTIITLDEFLSLSGVFTHCKTIGTKDNRLFVGNIRNQFSDIDFDARAYRWHANNALDLTENGVVNNYVLTPTTASNYIGKIVNDSDAINVDQSINKYKADGSTLGGEGINVSYEFMTIASAADINVAGDFNIPNDTPAPWRSCNPNFMTSSIDLGVKSVTNLNATVSQLHPTAYSFGKIKAGLKFPTVSTLLKGYQRNETYRFGIQFFDKSKNPLFVKWIGDIKMPDFWDTNSNAIFEDGTQAKYWDVSSNSYINVNDFRLTFTGSNNPGYSYSSSFPGSEAFVQSLGIKFTIKNLETISKQIDGYSIVRVERTESNKSIVNQGYITPVEKVNTTDFYMTALVNDVGNTNWGLNEGFDSSASQNGFYTTPYILDGALTSPAAGMNLTVSSLLINVNSIPTVQYGSGPYIDPYGILKYYNMYPSPTGENVFNLEQSDYIGYAGNITDTSTGGNVYNYDSGTNPAHTTSVQIGNPSYYIRANAGTLGIGFGWGYITTGSFPNGKYLATISRTLPAQYGGNKYSERADNTYIQCSHFRPIRTTSIAINDQFDIFGGDTLVNMWDSCRAAKNWGSTGRGQEAHRYSTTFMLPIECPVNVDLRQGAYMNKDINASFDGVGIEMRESYEYNGVYSAENNVKSYYPMPDPFVLNEEFDNRIYASEIKINGEFVDSWGVFKVNNYWDVEGTYGPINAMCILRDKMYFWQNRSFGLMQINPRAVITDINNATNSQLQIGTGNILQRHDYISTEVGLQHQWGLTKSSYKLFWADVKLKKMFSYGDGQALSPDSDIKGLFSFLKNNLVNNINKIDKPVYEGNLCDDKPLIVPTGINGIRAVYDFKYNQAIFTFSDGQSIGDCQTKTRWFTIAYDENLGVFTSFYDYTPKIYFTDGYKIFSTDRQNLSNIYMHDEGVYCKFYEFVYWSKVKMIVNDHFQYTKVFDNIMYDSQTVDTATGINYNDDTLSTIRVYNDYQNTDFQSLIVNNNIKRKERTWQLAIPRNRVLYSTSDSPDIFTDLSPTDKINGERMRDKYITIDLIYKNSTNRNIAINNLRTIYRQSPR